MSSLHSLVRLFLRYVAKVMPEMAQSEGFRLIWGVGVILRQLDMALSYCLHFICLRHLLGHSEPSRLALKHLPEATPLRRAGKNKGDGWSSLFIEVTGGDWARSTRVCMCLLPNSPAPASASPVQGATLANLFWLLRVSPLCL